MANNLDQFSKDSQFTGLGQKAVSSAVVLGVRRVLLQFIITGSNIVLARLLFPEIFGVFVILSFLVLIFSHIGDLGLGTALVQQADDPSVNQLRGVFTVHFLFSIVGFLLLWLVAPLLIGFYGSQLPERSVEMLRLFGLSLPLSVFGSNSSKMLERNLLYKKFGISEVIQIVVSKVIAIGMAFAGFGVAALVFAELGMRVVGSITNFILYPWPIGFSTRLRELSKLFSFALPFQVSAWIGFISGAVIPVYLGNFPGPGDWTGAQAVGFITFAAGLAGFARIFSEIIGQLIFPVLSRTQKNTKKIKMVIERTLEISSLATFGLIAVMMVFSRDIINIVYTSKWLPGLPVLRLLLFQGAEISLGLILMNALLALGASRIYLKMSVFWAILQWMLTVFFVMKFGFIGFGWASIIVSATGIVIPWYLLSKRVKFKFFSKLLILFVLALVTLVVTVFFKQFVIVSSIWNLFLIAGLSVLFYGLLVLVFLRESVIFNFGYFWRLFWKNKS